MIIAMLCITAAALGVGIALWAGWEFKYGKDKDNESS